MTTPVPAPAREDWVDRYRRTRARSRALFDLLTDDAYYTRPIALRHPIVFYEGHLPAFTFNTLIKKAFGRRGIDPELEQLFARGIDPEDERLTGQAPTWPQRERVLAFGAEVDRQVLDVLEHEDLDRPGHPLLDHAEAVFSVLEHEAMHQETLLYMWHRLPLNQKRRPVEYDRPSDKAPPRQEWLSVGRGIATLGMDRRAMPFGWDNEHPVRTETVGAFEIDRHDVTNAAFLEFVEAGGYRDVRWWTPEDSAWLMGDAISHPMFWEHAGGRWLWRGMFERFPLPLSWPVYVSFAEASAFARWRGARLPTEVEFQRAAYGSPAGERFHPWGNADVSPERGVFDFSSWEPRSAGTHPLGASAWGVEDLVGNGWEWTNTTFAPFPGFEAMASYPEYSADFFDGQHIVMKGASPATAHELLRPTFRNWFRPRYPYVYATFRCVRTGSR